LAEASVRGSDRIRVAFTSCAVIGRKASQRPGNIWSIIARRLATLASAPCTTSGSPKTITDR
jgi:hypothetical protein